MPLTTIYVVRHGYRSNWTTDHLTGQTTSTVPSPTNIPSDPALSAYGVQQAAQLAEQATVLTPPIARVYSSPFYRCLQTITPFVERLKGQAPLICDRGLGEWYGTARFTHPVPAPLTLLRTFFPTLTERTAIVPSSNGETIADLHNRCAYALDAIITDCDGFDANAGLEAIMICTHAATMIAMGRVLTGRMPEDITERDFHAYTCSISKYERKHTADVGRHHDSTAARGGWAEGDAVPDIGWREGRGVGGGWTCVANAKTSHLSGGGERDWHFAGDESFIQESDTATSDAEVDNEEREKYGSEGGERVRKTFYTTEKAWKL
ncbi:hypothetical protein MMC19_002437 [Ptychographa xylographoides]|nr:hypothetical protein [Ptychographa xylographoides]